MRDDALAVRGIWLGALVALFVGALAGAAAADSLTPVELLRHMQESYSRVQSYECLVSTFARKGSRTERVTLQLAFKKPAMLRARVVAGHGRGSEVAIRRDGRIRGHPGGLLRGIRKTLARDDRRLRNLRGEPVWEADWGAFLPKIAAALGQPSRRAVVRPGKDGALLLEIRLDGTAGRERQRYLVDGSTYHVRRAERFIGDVMVSRVVYEQEKLNPDLPDGYFNM